MQRLSHLQRPILLIATIVLLAATTGYFTRGRWLPRRVEVNDESSAGAQSNENAAAPPTENIILSDQAIANLRLKAKAARPQTFWKTIQVPGMVVDRPGQSDRNIVSPAAGIVARVHHFPGDTVRPGDVLFSIQLLSDSLHASQSDLFKATQDIKLAKAQRERLRGAGEAIPGARLIEVDNQITRLQVAVKASYQELINRGLTPTQIDRVTAGEFVREITITVPNRLAGGSSQDAENQPPGQFAKHPEPTFEVQELKVELGQQVQAGQTLCLLANHRSLAIEGRAFRDETPLLERSVKEGWPVQVDFQEAAAGDWPPLTQTFPIRQLANTIDPVNRTFAFLMPLENQSKVVQTNDRTQMLWRFRPGQKVRLLVRVEQLDNVLVLPAEAVARVGAEAFVFTQNVNTFERKPVRLVTQDRQHAVVANDGSVLPGQFVVQNVAAQLDRMAKSQSSSVPKGYHVHADGSLHKNEDEAK